LAFIPTQAVAAIIGHPQKLLANPNAEWLPTEVIAAAGMQEGGFDPLKLKEVVVLFATPTRGPEPEIGVILRFAEPYAKAGIVAAMKGRETTLGEHKVIEVPGPKPFVWNFADDKTLVGGTAEMLKGMLAAKDVDSPLVGLLKRVDVSSCVTAVFSIDAVRPLMKQAIAAAPPVPPPFQDFLKLPDLVSAMLVKVNLGETLSVSLTLRAVDEAAAPEAERIVNQGLAMARQMFMQQIAMSMGQNNDPVQQATVKYFTRIVNKLFDEIKPSRKGQNVTLALESNSSMAAISMLAFVAVPFTAVRSARMAEERARAVEESKEVEQSRIKEVEQNRKSPDPK
jgi:hypothetical protein